MKNTSEIWSFLDEENNPNQKRSQLLLELALRIVKSEIPPHVINFYHDPFSQQKDIIKFWGNYQQACQEANELSLSLFKETPAKLCQKSPLGKKLPNALYIHHSAVPFLALPLQFYERLARSYLTELIEPTLIKFQIYQEKISYLIYPDFDQDPHPALRTSIQVDLSTGKNTRRDYHTRENPPILHRKETFVTPDYPYYKTFLELTKKEEELGLLQVTRLIGTRQGWEKVLSDFGVKIKEHTIIHLQEPVKIEPFLPPNLDPLISAKELGETETLAIDRHRAALMRKELSKPVRLALEANFFTEETTFFDYGCGYGTDVELMTEKGYISTGWDPYYHPQNPFIFADIVNLGYVINVIESPPERQESLLKAWELTQKILIVSAQVLITDKNQEQIVYGDGIITRRNTFQKYYEQEELKNYIDQTLNVNSIPIALGIYFVFRDEIEAENFRASHFHRSLRTPRIHHINKHFEDYQELLTPLMNFMSDRGRLPRNGELAEEALIKAEFKSFRTAFKVILQVTEPSEWDLITDKRRQDLLVYLALRSFDINHRHHLLPTVLKNDIKSLFSSYEKACMIADLMLFNLGKPNRIRETCQQSKIGKIFADSLWVHISALAELEPLLRLYEGCANRIIGSVEDATLIKFHTQLAKITYLFYPDFDINPHPVLQKSIQIDLQNVRVRYKNYRRSPHAPVLIKKEELVSPDYPLYQKFRKFTQLEQEWGLLENLPELPHQQQWLEHLQNHCVRIKDYRIFWRGDANPERVKQLKEEHNQRLQKKATRKPSNLPPKKDL